MSDFVLVAAQFVLVCIALALASWIAIDLSRTYPADPQELIGVNKWRGRLMVLIALLVIIVILQLQTLPMGLLAAFPELFQPVRIVGPS